MHMQVLLVRWLMWHGLTVVTLSLALPRGLSPPKDLGRAPAVLCVPLRTVQASCLAALPCLSPPKDLGCAPATAVLCVPLRTVQAPLPCLASWPLAPKTLCCGMGGHFWSSVKKGCWKWTVNFHLELAIISAPTSWTSEMLITVFDGGLSGKLHENQGQFQIIVCRGNTIADSQQLNQGSVCSHLLGLWCLIPFYCQKELRR